MGLLRTLEGANSSYLKKIKNFRAELKPGPDKKSLLGDEVGLTWSG